MIIIERYWSEESANGYSDMRKSKRKCFSDDDFEGIEKFINEKVSDYKYANVVYKYIKI